MVLGAWMRVLRTPHKRALFRIADLAKSQARMIVYHALIETGMGSALRTWRTPGELSRAFGLEETVLLAGLLDMGVSLGDLARRGGRYRLRGPMAGVLEKGNPIADYIREQAQYHADVAMRIGTYLQGGEKGDYLSRLGDIIAGSSRLSEPFIRAFIHHVLAGSGPHNILEIGCGAGAYLKYYLQANPANRGVGVERDEKAVRVAREQVKADGIDGRFGVEHADILLHDSLPQASFDLATSYSNVYYFSRDDRMRLVQPQDIGNTLASRHG